ncbi:MAG: SAM-dependent DNA methyltransferase, partial [Bacteroidota bacterium]
NLGKTNPLNENDVAEFVALQKTRADSLNSWSVDVTSIDPNNYDLSAKNPNKKEEAALRDPKAIIDEMLILDQESAVILNKIRGLV